MTAAMAAEHAERLRRDAAGYRERAESFDDEQAVQMMNELADQLDRQAAEWDQLAQQHGNDDEGGDEPPAENGSPTNPAEQIGDAAKAVEEAAVETAQAAADAGYPELAEAVAERVVARLQAANEQIEAASEEVEEAAEAVAAEAPAGTEAADQAEQAVEEAQEAGEAVEVAEEAIRDEVRPHDEHWWFRKRRRDQAEVGS